MNSCFKGRDALRRTPRAAPNHKEMQDNSCPGELAKQQREGPGAWASKKHPPLPPGHLLLLSTVSVLSGSESRPLHPTVCSRRAMAGRTLCLLHSKSIHSLVLQSLIPMVLCRVGGSPRGKKTNNLVFLLLLKTNSHRKLGFPKREAYFLFSEKDAGV